ncbi:MAG: hypothetical protein JNM14_09830 [Ferruginibacter sp.]|nr:hypothetical protein [Ferruginibacter sp.]
METRNDILNELKALSPTLAAIEKVNVFTVPAGYFEYLGADILMGIQTENGMPHSVDVADVPTGYFETLSDSILSKIKAQETESDILPAELAGLPGKNVYEVPAGYFDALPNSILAKIKAEEIEDAATEIRILSPMLYSIQNENVFELPQGYFENLSAEVLGKVKPQAKVVTMNSRSRNIFKYAVAAAFTGVMALGVFKFTDSPPDKIELPNYVKIGLNDIKDVDQELATISDADIVKYLEENGTDIKTTMVANSIDENELPSQEDYLLDEKALDNYLNSININDLKN